MVDAKGGVHYLSKSAQLLFPSNPEFKAGSSWFAVVQDADRSRVEALFHDFVDDASSEGRWTCQIRSCKTPRSADVRAVNLLLEPDTEGILLFLEVSDA
ncbi:hypothetical protein BH23BAC4_BH23BAC4_04330 [soil metagenome]